MFYNNYNNKAPNLIRPYTLTFYIRRHILHSTLDYSPIITQFCKRLFKVEYGHFALLLTSRKYIQYSPQKRFIDIFNIYVFPFLKPQEFVPINFPTIICITSPVNISNSIAIYPLCFNRYSLDTFLKLCCPSILRYTNPSLFTLGLISLYPSASSFISSIVLGNIYCVSMIGT